MRQMLVQCSLLFILSNSQGCTAKEDISSESSAPLSNSDVSFVADTTEYFSRLEKLGFAGGLQIARGDVVNTRAG